MLVYKNSNIYIYIALTIGASVVVDAPENIGINKEVKSERCLCLNGIVQFPKCFSM